MTEIRIGDIVRRSAGKVPMEVVRAGPATGRSLVRYCDGRPYNPAVTPGSMLKTKTLVRLTSWSVVDDYPGRLTDRQKEQLRRQSGVAPTNNQHETEDTIMPALYQTKEETPRFGVRIGTNSEGKAVLEMKPGGSIETFEPRAIEEVKPFTVAVKFENSATEYHYLSRKGDVEKGDLLIIDGYADMARVTALNTRSDKAKVTLKGRKVMTTPFGQGLSDTDCIDS